METKQNWTYCVVGNIKKTHYDAEGTLRYGTAAFTGGTKVYLSGRLWDRTRDHINALGLTRGKRLEVIWTEVSQIENLRCQKVFNPAIGIAFRQPFLPPAFSLGSSCSSTIVLRFCL